MPGICRMNESGSKGMKNSVIECQGIKNLGIGSDLVKIEQGCWSE